MGSIIMTEPVRERIYINALLPMYHRGDTRLTIQHMFAYSAYCMREDCLLIGGLEENHILPVQ